MTCGEAEALIEAIAGGETPATDGFRSHVESCPRCAGALSAAMRLEQALRAWPAPSAPPSFRGDLLVRVRRERWQMDQRLDWAFNAAIAVAVAIVALGAVALFNAGTVTAGIISVTGTLVSAASPDAGGQTAPPTWSYLLACGLLGTSLLVWKWAEGSKQ